MLNPSRVVPWLIVFCGWVCAAGLNVAPPARAEEPQWIWSTPDARTQAPAGRMLFRTTFDAPALESATLEIACDNVYALFVNNERIGAGIEWHELDSYNVKSALRVGKNCIAVLAENSGPGPAGLVVRARLKPQQGPEQQVLSGKTWKFSPRETPGWREARFNDSEWQAAAPLGELGKTAPWGELKLHDRGSAVPEFVRKQRPPGPFQLLDGDRVVFVGDTLIERASRDDYWEAFLTARYPQRNITFRNLGWSGDTPGGDARAGFGTAEDGYQQLKSQVYFTRPSVILVCYGAVSSFEGPAGLPRFQEGLNRLLDDLAVTKAEILLLSPLRHEHLPKPLPDPAQHNRELERYTAAIREIAQSRGLRFIDLYNGLIGSSMVQPDQALTDNGLHLKPGGYARLAAFFETGLGWPATRVEIGLNAQGKVTKETGATVTAVEATADRLQFRVSNTRLPTPPGKFSPPPKLQVAGLSKGNWALASGDTTVVTATAEDWARGVEITQGPGFERFEALRSKIVEKNQLYFHRWRPQNETYLFGFRKHEQGQNAKEIPMFDPLVEKLEAEIALLRQPTDDDWVLSRVR